VLAPLPDWSAQALINLPAGQYVILCLVLRQATTPSSRQGMIKSLQFNPRQALLLKNQPAT